MTIVYVFENTLYLNITNRCTNSCDFCVRTVSDGYYSENSLWLEYEPSLDEILTALEKYKFDDYKEIVFCGYGEPTCRLNIMLQVCRFIRKKAVLKSGLIPTDTLLLLNIMIPLRFSRDFWIQYL